MAMSGQSALLWFYRRPSAKAFVVQGFRLLVHFAKSNVTTVIVQVAEPAPSVSGTSAEALQAASTGHTAQHTGAPQQSSSFDYIVTNVQPHMLVGTATEPASPPAAIPVDTEERPSISRSLGNVAALLDAHDQVSMSEGHMQQKQSVCTKTYVTLLSKLNELFCGLCAMCLM